MLLDTIQYLLGAASGSLVGFTLGLFGGGGSILAVPLMVYLVGVPLPHVAIGTSAVAVAANAASNLIAHARRGNVIWRCALLYTVAGVAGAALGSVAGKAMNGNLLLLLFAALMVVVGVLMFRARRNPGTPNVVCNREKAPRVLGYGGATGALSGFFGIGGGFLIVPGLVASTGMPMLNAIGSSLVAVTAFGLTTAISYAMSGLVDWTLAALFVAGGIVGGYAGTWVAGKLAARKGALNSAFAALVIVVAIYMAARSALELMA
ncbi:sulfite exporter TauE/SafE family protein [Devosia sp. ZB163]|uniref:sulfite exporter TauE/SafE family protein n=1 Tax=Devosia sp. ZB163 TaxID=3025938 RepID=UPI0023615FA9|nr:sulfite exporter TauE/SafE family protein [Devosia sp. ZB163]MDC9823687.1 sulfite exporter TauE/SafE family protein [Devosia sp. ZB163]